MSRKSAPPRRVSSDAGRTRAERGKKRAGRARRERARGKEATRRSRAAAGGRKGERGGGAWARPSPATATADRFPQRRRGGRSPPAPEDEGAASAASWRGARGPVPAEDGAPMAGAGSARRGNPGRRVESRDDAASHDGWPGPGRHSGAPFQTGPRAAEGRGTPRAQRHNDAATAGPRRRQTRSGAAADHGGRHATAGAASPSHPADGVAARRNEADRRRRRRRRRRPGDRPPRQRGAGGRRGGDGARWGQAGHRRPNREVESRDNLLSLGEEERKREETGPGGRESEPARRAGTTRDLTAREGPSAGPRTVPRKPAKRRLAFSFLPPPETTSKPTSRR